MIARNDAGIYILFVILDGRQAAEDRMTLVFSKSYDVFLYDRIRVHYLFFEQCLNDKDHTNIKGKSSIGQLWIDNFIYSLQHKTTT